MAEFIPAENTVRCTVWQSGLLQKFCNTFYVRNSEPWTEASMIALGETITDAWNAHVGPLQSDDIRYDYVTIRDMTTAEGLGIDHGFNPLSGGDRIGPNLPLNVACACKLVTAYSGRSRRGRIFLSGFEEDQVNDNNFTDVAKAQIETNMRSLVQDINAGVGEVVVASFFSGMALEPNSRGETVWTPQPRAAALLTAVQNVIVDGFVDSQRRRLTGRGN